ncbi:MAG: tetratricopeptide repeat protein [Isosphaeraceae bacterium]
MELQGRRRWGIWLAGLALLLGLGWWGWTVARITSLRSQAHAAFVAGDWGTAEPLLAALLASRPSDEEALQMRVEAAVQRQDLPTATAVLEGWPARSPLAGEAALRKGRLYKERFLTGLAERAFEEAARLLPDDPAPSRELVGLYGVERRAEEQVRTLWLLHKRGARIEALRLLGQSSVVIPPGTIAKTSDEGELLEKCLAADPEDVHLRAPLARFYRMRGQVSEARALLEPWLPSHDDLPARLERLTLGLDEGDPAPAAAYFGLFQNKPTPESASFWQVRGDWHALQQDHAAAAADYQAAAERDPRDAEVVYRLARSLRAAGKTVEAEAAEAQHRRLVDYAEKSAAVAQDAPRVEALLAAARAAAALGPPRAREAKAWYEEVLRLDRNDKEARRRWEVAREAARPGVVWRDDRSDRRLAVPRIERATLARENACRIARWEHAIGHSGCAGRTRLGAEALDARLS